MMHGRGKSDPAIVAGKPANKVEPSTAEPEPRAGTEGNAGQQSACRTQSRAGASQALERIRQTFAVWTRGRSRMRESCMYGSGRGARGNSRPYRDVGAARRGVTAPPARLCAVVVGFRRFPNLLATIRADHRSVSPQALGAADEMVSTFGTNDLDV
jgi:hypothetical protein